MFAIFFNSVKICYNYCINLQLPIVIFKRSIILNMHHRITCMYTNFQQNRLSRPVKTVHANLFAKTRKLDKFATINNNLIKINYFRHS